MSAPATLDDLGTTVQGMVADVGAKFTEPDDDWVPMMFVQSKDTLHIVGLPFYLFGSGAEKSQLAAVLQEAMRKLGAFRFALLLNAHGLDLSKLSPEEAAEVTRRVSEEEVRIEDLPGAIEQLMLIVGDAETEIAWQALIERHEGSPPTLTPWVSITGEGGRYEGRFSGLGEALREVRA